MKCPKCGSEIKEGHLYCEKCGEEIRIVPDFDATVDDGINISFTDDIDTEGVIDELSKVATKEIASEIDKEATKEISMDTISIENINDIDAGEKQDNKPDEKIVIKALVIAGALCVVFVLIGLFINNKVNNYYSVDKQYESAFDLYENGNYEESIRTLKHAISISPDDARLKMLIADNYNKLEKYDESNAVLYELLSSYGDDTAIYEKIIKNSEANGDYLAISKLLNDTNNEDLMENYSQYLVKDVEFSIDSGVYDEIKFLELSSNTGATIYYTIDGTEANANSLVYTEPIELNAGEYIFNAIAINEYGIASGNIQKEYTIDFFVPDAPVVLTKSGTYNVPTPIDVNFADYDICYYTVDGEDPTIDDEKLVGKLPMYIGKHTYKFAVISSKGVSSDVVSLDISLDLVILVDMETATNSIINWKTSNGGIDYSYKCEQATVYNNSTYYIINEYTESANGKELTGNHYAIDVLNGLPFRAILNKSTGEYTLEALR